MLHGAANLGCQPHEVAPVPVVDGLGLLQVAGERGGERQQVTKIIVLGVEVVVAVRPGGPSRPSLVEDLPCRLRVGDVVGQHPAHFRQRIFERGAPCRQSIGGFVPEPNHVQAFVGQHAVALQVVNLRGGVSKLGNKRLPVLRLHVHFQAVYNLLLVGNDLLQPLRVQIGGDGIFQEIQTDKGTHDPRFAEPRPLLDDKKRVVVAIQVETHTGHAAGCIATGKQAVLLDA